MSDPKTSLNKAVAFQDRLAVIGNASFICFVVSVIWTALFISRGQFSASSLIYLSAPLIATGLTVILGSIIRDLVPKSIISSPLNITIPLIWSTSCFLTVLLISTQETGSTRVPEALMPALAWANLSNLLPVLFGQIIVLSILVFITKESA